MHCPVVNSAIPLPHYHMTATLRAATDGTVIEQLLDKQTDYLNLDKTILSALFDNDTVFINITCNVHNVFGNDERTTSITVCGEYILCLEHMTITIPSETFLILCPHKNRSGQEC